MKILLYLKLSYLPCLTVILCLCFQALSVYFSLINVKAEIKITNSLFNHDLSVAIYLFFIKAFQIFDFL